MAGGVVPATAWGAGPRVRADGRSRAAGPADVLAGVRARAGDLGLGRALATGMDLRARVVPLAGRPGLEVVRVEGRALGIPLARPVAAVLVDRVTDRVVLWVGHGAVPAMPPRFDVRVDEGQALAVVAGSGRAGSRGASGARLVAVPEGTQTYAAWRVDPPADRRTLENLVFYVDAQTGAIRKIVDRTLSARVRAFSRNPVLDAEAKIFELKDVDPNPTNLSGPYFQARNCVWQGGPECVPTPLAVPDGNGDFLAPAPDVTNPDDNLQPEDVFSETSIYFHSDKFRRWLTNLGFAGLQCNQDGERATLVANFRNDEFGLPPAFDNAYYTGDCGMTMVFGQGTSVDLAYDGDVVYHELGHGVVEAHTPGSTLLNPRLRSEALVVDAGAMNEGLADFFSSAFANDPVVGDYLGVYWLGQDGVRNNDNEFTCPRDLIGQVHKDSEPMAGALWDTYTELGWPMVTVVLDALKMMPDDITFEEASGIFVAVTQASLGEDAAAVLAENLELRNLVDCPRILAWDEQVESMWVDHGAGGSPAPGPLQLRVDTPPDAVSVRIDIQVGQVDPEGTPEPAAWVRGGSPVEFSVGDIGFEAVADAVFMDIQDNSFLVTDLTAPGEPLFVALGNQGSATMLTRIVSVSVSTEEPPGTTGTTGTTYTTGFDVTGDTVGDTVGDTTGVESGPAAADEFLLAERGCACTVRAAPGSPGRRGVLWAPWIVAALLVRRRSRF